MAWRTEAAHAMLQYTPPACFHQVAITQVLVILYWLQAGFKIRLMSTHSKVTRQCAAWHKRCCPAPALPCRPRLLGSLCLVWMIIASLAAHVFAGNKDYGSFRLFAKQGQPPGWHYNQYDFRPAYQYYQTADDEQDQEIKFDVESAGFQTGALAFNP